MAYQEVDHRREPRMLEHEVLHGTERRLDPFADREDRLEQLLAELDHVMDDACELGPHAAAGVLACFLGTRRRLLRSLLDELTEDRRRSEQEPREDSRGIGVEKIDNLLDELRERSEALLLEHRDDLVKLRALDERDHRRDEARRHHALADAWNELDDVEHSLEHPLARVKRDDDVLEAEVVAEVVEERAEPAEVVGGQVDQHGI